MKEKGKENPAFLNKRNIFFLILACFLFSAPFIGKAATLSLSPSGGSFTVGSTFDVSVFLDTQKESVNVIDAVLIFPPDKLQLVSPSVGKSIIEIWTASPKFNNQTGSVKFQGGIPGGINVSQGLVTALTFRVKNTGSALVKFSDESSILLNDGKGTDVLGNTQSSIFNLILPPPSGPFVVSETHPDSSKWYSNPNVILRWQSEANGFSYVLSDDPLSIPDDTSEGSKNYVAYKNLSDGAHFFHLKAIRDGVWGGITHFLVNVDATPPAQFEINFIPDSKTTRRRPIISFDTTDNFSGTDHYEIKLMPLFVSNVFEDETKKYENLFIETESPYVPAEELEVGSYDVIVRAYDKVGNYRDQTKKLRITNILLEPISDQGLKIRGFFILPWFWVLVILGFLIASLVYMARHFWQWHRTIDGQRLSKELPSEIKEKLKELNDYRKKYGKKLICAVIFIGFSLMFNSVFAQELSPEIGPPNITTISRSISNEEIFYLGGKTEIPNSTVIVYIQGLMNGGTISKTVNSDKKGDWFYRHDTFLTSGDYRIWTQNKLGELTSPPSPQLQITVRPTALQFGSSRISYETLYFIVAALLFLIVLLLGAYVIYHFYHGRKKRQLFMKEIKEAEESINRGFAVLKRDIEAELEIIRKAKLNKKLSQEEQQLENQLLEDLESTQKYISKEIWDVERAEG